MSLSITIGGKNLAFLPTGDVAIIAAGGAQTVHGAWRTAVTGAEPQDNKVHYTLDGEDQPPIQALYSVDDTSRQLDVVIQASDGTRSASTAFLGGIEIDDAHHLIYNLMDDTGGDLGKSITVYGGNFRFEDGTASLLMDLANGGQISIPGDSGVTSLEADENRIAGFDADDLLHFHASTDNTLADGSVTTVPAKLSFIGTWDIQNGELVFLSKITGDITQPDVHIGFGGKFGAITAGFEYFADSAGTQLAFNISGQHVWKAGNTSNAFNWQSTIGFSRNTFSAQASFDLDSQSTSGSKFSIDGNLTLQQPVGGNLTLDFTLKGQYQWNNNLLTFQADVSNVAGALTYDLMLEGTLKLDHGTITFDVKFSNTAAGNSFSVTLNFAGDRNSVIQALSVNLQISPTQAGIMINATVSIKLVYVRGVGRLQAAAAA
jgi:hypothetical protein